MCSPHREISDPVAHPSGRWVSAIVAEVAIVGDVADTSTRLMMWPIEGGEPHELAGSGEPLVGHGLSGGVHCWSPDGESVFVVTREGLWHGLFDSATARMKGWHKAPLDDAKSWWGPIVSPDNAKLAIIADWHEVVELTFRGLKQRTVDSTHAYAMDATWWNDEPIFHAWSRPAMSWTQSSIAPGVAVGGQVQRQQPRSSPDGKLLGFLSDEMGTLNLRIIDREGNFVTHVIDVCEHGGPTWGPGQRTWCFSPDSRYVAYTRNEMGFGALCVYDTATHNIWRIGKAVHGCLSWEGNHIVALRSGAVTPRQLVSYDVSNLDHPQRVVLDDGDTRWTDEWRSLLVEPDVMVVPAATGDVPLRLYRSTTPINRLICWIHGGPTDQWQVEFMPRLAFWLSRGYDIAVIDHRGTTGHGRAFMTALHGAWGSADVDDLLGCVEWLHSNHGYASGRTVLMGASAGGLTILGAVAKRPSAVAAVVTSFPVVDLELLVAGDDPFESHYVPQLVGNDVVGRSPLRHANNIAQVPVLVCHGDRDNNVELEHSRRLANAVSGAGGRVDLHVMEGEGHGFRKLANVLKEYALAEEFLNSVIR